MEAINAPEFDGVLNSNEIYEGLYNLKIIGQRLVPQTVGKDEIVDLITKATGMYGDSYVLQGGDIQGTYDFKKDAEASKLLAINRNKTQKIERYVINEWRQTDVTVDEYISKRAFLDEGIFEMFNSYLVTTLDKAMDAFENGFVKSALGTYKYPVDACNIKVLMPAKDGTEATERLRIAAIKKAILDIKTKSSDPSRDYNKYKFYGKVNWDEFTEVFNAEFTNEMNANALYQTFNPEYLKNATEGRQWASKWFGTPLTKGGQTGPQNKTVYSYIEQNSDGSTELPISDEKLAQGIYRIYPGDLLPNSFTYKANEAYEVNNKIIGKIFAPEFVIYMTGYKQGDVFHNSRSATDNHYLRKGHSKVQVSGFRPFFTLEEVNPKEELQAVAAKATTKSKAPETV